LYVFLTPSMRATCPIPLILFIFIALVIYGEDYSLWSSLLCSFLQPAPFLGPVLTGTRYKPAEWVLLM
jgi:hypothetical protein